MFWDVSVKNDGVRMEEDVSSLSDVFFDESFDVVVKDQPPQV